MRFRIEFRFPSTRRPAVVFARALEPGNFALGPRPTLGGVRIQRAVTQPRALRPDGSPDLDLYGFALESRADIIALEVGAEVLLEDSAQPVSPDSPAVRCEHLDVIVDYDHPHGTLEDVPVRELQASPPERTRLGMCLRNPRCNTCGFLLSPSLLNQRTSPTGDLYDSRFVWDWSSS